MQKLLKKENEDILIKSPETEKMSEQVTNPNYIRSEMIKLALKNL